MVEMLKRRVNVSVKIYELFFSDLKIIFSHVEAEACGKIKCGQGLDFLSLNIIIKAYTSFYISLELWRWKKRNGSSIWRGYGRRNGGSSRLVLLIKSK